MARQWIGRAMIAAPFVALFGWVSTTAGIFPALGVFGGVAFIVAWIGVGVGMMSE